MTPHSRTVRVGPQPSDTARVIANDDLHAEIVPAAKAARREKRPPKEVASLVKSLDSSVPEWEALKAAQAECAERRVKARGLVDDARAKFAISGDPDDGMALDVAESAFRRVDGWCRAREGAARAEWVKACDRQKREQEAAADLALLKSIALEGRS